MCIQSVEDSPFHTIVKGVMTLGSLDTNINAEFLTNWNRLAKLKQLKAICK